MMYDDENKGTNGERPNDDNYISTKFSKELLEEPKRMSDTVIGVIWGICLIGIVVVLALLPFERVVAVCLVIPLTSPFFYMFGKLVISRKYWNDDAIKKKRMWSLGTLSLLLLCAPIAVLVFMGPLNITLLDSSGLWASVFLITSALTAIAILLIFFYSKDIKRVLKISGMIAIIVFTYTWSGIVASNAAFDKYPTEQRFGVITDQRRVARRHGATYNLDISLGGGNSLRSYSVNRNFFNSVEADEVIRVCTRPGFWGLEWVSCIHKVDPALQPMLELMYDYLDLDTLELMLELLQP